MLDLFRFSVLYAVVQNGQLSLRLVGESGELARVEDIAQIAYEDSTKRIVAFGKSAMEFGQMVGEREALAPMQARNPETRRPIDVPIGNVTSTYPRGDHVQTIEPWTPSGLWVGVTEEIARTIITEIDRGDADSRPYSNHPNAKSRAAWPVVQRYLPNLTESLAREMIKTWMRTGALLAVDDLWDPKDRKSVEGLKMNPANMPGNRWS